MPGLLEFLQGNQAFVLSSLHQHVMICLTAISIGFVIAFPVGVLLTRNKKAARIVLGIFGVVNTIPSLVLLGVVMIVLGLGFRPAVTVLFIYSLLPIMRNTYTGIMDVPPKYIKVATGMGMSRLQTLIKVQIPLALPAIITGVRLSTVYVISWATLSSFIGAGGLGDLIWSGLQSFNFTMVMVGAFMATLLALASGFIFSLAEKASARHAQGGRGNK